MEVVTSREKISTVAFKQSREDECEVNKVVICKVELGNVDVYSWGGPAKVQVQDISSLVCWSVAVKCQVKMCKRKTRQEDWSLSEGRLKSPRRVREVTSVGKVLSYWRMSSLTVKFPREPGGPKITIM